MLKAGAQNMVIYDDSLESGWQKNGWATINYSNPGPVHSGTASISVTNPGSASQALYLGHANFDPSSYQSLSFWIYPTAPGSNQLQVQAVLDGAPQTAVPISFTPPRSITGSLPPFPSPPSASPATRPSTASGYKTFPAARSRFTSMTSPWPASRHPTRCR